ncbi:CENSYa [Acrasis kona]|uniref:CENSYa n=1 Tax=Acrasis kona TaxID=1008807 RepID=A0AAW2YI96_9EUKA
MVNIKDWTRNGLWNIVYPENEVMKNTGLDPKMISNSAQKTLRKYAAGGHIKDNEVHLLLLMNR